MKIKVGLIGYGYWGEKYSRILKENPNVDFTIICDTNFERVKEAQKHTPSTLHFSTAIGKADAFIVATPVTTHFGITSDVIWLGKHILVEKAFAYNNHECEILTDLALGAKVKLAVGHTYEHNSYVQEIKRMIDEGYLGEIYYVNMTRVGNSPLRNDVGCIYDLAAHDISMLLYWFDEMPEYVSAFGQSYLQDGLEDAGYINLKFSKNKIANIRCSWVNPIKRRNVTIVGSKRMVSFDDVARTLEVYEGDKKEVLNIEYKEPLKEQVNDFIDSIINNREPKVNGEKGLKVVMVLEQCQQSLKSNFTQHQQIKLEV